MNLAEVQQFGAGQITADPTLAALGAPIVYSLGLDDESTRASIAAALRTKGVVFEIGLPSGTDDEGERGRFAKLMIDFDVFVAENPKVSHTPAALDLVTAVIRAVCKPNDMSETPAKCTGYDVAKSEHGYVLHIISFNVPVLLR